MKKWRGLIALAIALCIGGPAVCATQPEKGHSEPDKPRRQFRPRSRAELISMLKHRGYRLHLGSFDSGRLEKDGCRAQMEFFDGKDKGVYQWGMNLETDLILPHPIDQKAVESWYRRKPIGGCKLYARVDDVVEVHRWLYSDTASLGQLEQFWRLCEGVRRVFHATQGKPSEPAGRCPSDDVRLTGLSYAEFATMASVWGWKLIGPISDMGPWCAYGTVGNVKVYFETWETPDKRFTVGAEIPIVNGVAIQRLEARLRANPTPDIHITPTSPVQVKDSLAAGWEPWDYRFSREIEFHGMTVGQFRHTIEDFARRVKELPHK